MSNPLVTGIAIGLITSLIVWVIRILWKKVFTPWLDNRLNKGTRIDGIWQTTMVIDGKTVSEQVTLKQYGHKVTGTINYPKDTEGKSHTYKVEGKFLDGTLILLQEETGPKRQDWGCIVLDFKQGGANPILEGLGVWSYEGEIVAVPYKWIGN